MNSYPKPGIDDILVSTIRQSPGIRFNELARTTGLSSGVMTCHFDRLSHQNLIKVSRQPRVTRYYPPDSSDAESLILSYLRREVMRDIVVFLL